MKNTQRQYDRNKRTKGKKTTKPHKHTKKMTPGWGTATKSIRQGEGNTIKMYHCLVFSMLSERIMSNIMKLRCWRENALSIIHLNLHVFCLILLVFVSVCVHFICYLFLKWFELAALRKKNYDNNKKTMCEWMKP